MKKKVKRFKEGGFSPEQEEWLGGADRTDPFILARMRSAVPDKPQAKESFETATGKNKNISDDTREKAMKYVKDYEEKGDSPKTKTVTKTTVSTTPAKPVAKPPAPAMPAEEKARIEKLSKNQALERVEPEGYIPGPRMIANLLKSGSKFLGKDKLREYTMEEFEKMTPKLGRESLKLTKESPKLGMKKGGSVKKMASGGKVSSASKRADGCAVKGKTRGRMV
jgi:hypothetical protein